MKKAISDFWKILINSIKELDDPSAKLVAGVVFIVVILIFIMAISSICFGFVEHVLEIIGSVITTATGNAPLELPK